MLLFQIREYLCISDEDKIYSPFNQLEKMGGMGSGVKSYE